MRMLLKASMDTEKANDVIRSGKMPEMVQEVMEQLKPEAAYFTLDGGVRTAYIVFDMQDSSQMPPTAEAFFLGMNARLDMTPIMNSEDLQKGLAGLR
ncbi:hypothetical protein [Streptomyces sp. YIM S03343]